MTLPTMYDPNSATSPYGNYIVLIRDSVPSVAGVDYSTNYYLYNTKLSAGTF